MSNSPLVNCTIYSPNHSGYRDHKIDRITPHCVVGQLSATGIGSCFPSGRDASCNYGIGYDGKVVLVVDENKCSWCSSSSSNDDRAVTIECASDAYHPYAFNTAVYNKLIDLCVDICKRNGKKKLLWIANQSQALAYTPKSDEMLLTVHRWFDTKACPGDWLMARMGDLASKVTTKLSGSSTGAVVADKPIEYKKPTIKAEVKKNKDGYITDIMLKATGGTARYRVHEYKGYWLPAVTGSNWNDYNNGYAGDGHPIDAVKVYFDTDVAQTGKYYKACYKVNDYPYQYDEEVDANQDGYAGEIGKRVKSFEIKLVEC